MTLFAGHTEEHAKAGNHLDKGVDANGLFGGLFGFGLKLCDECVETCVGRLGVLGEFQTAAASWSICPALSAVWRRRPRGVG